MAGMEIEFDDQEKQHLQNEMRRRGGNAQNIGYDEDALKMLATKDNTVYMDKRLALSDNWPSLSIWALNAPTEDRLMRQRVTKFVYETLGTMIFLWFVIFSVFVKVDVTQGTFTGIPWFLSIQSLYTAWVQAFGLGLALVACGYFSAEFNSTYTLVVAFFPRPGRKIGATLITALIKILGQHLGAFLGALLALAVLGNGNFPGGSGTLPGFPGVPGSPGFGFGFGITLYSPSTAQAWVFEMLGSMMLGLLMMIIQFNPPSTLTKHPQLTLPFTLLALVIFGCPITGAVYNWTRYFGHAVVALIAGGSFGGFWWVFLTAPLVGHILAAILYIFVFRF